MLSEVLLVDDDEIALMLCEMVMEHNRFARKIIKTRNGIEALDYFAKLKREPKLAVGIQFPDLVFLDLNMPLMDGWEFLEVFEKQFGNLYPEVKVCILTSSVDPLDFSHSKTYQNVVGFLEKPFTSESLKEIIANEQLHDLFQSS